MRIGRVQQPGPEIHADRVVAAFGRAGGIGVPTRGVAEVDPVGRIAVRRGRAEHGDRVGGDGRPRAGGVVARQRAHLVDRHVTRVQAPALRPELKPGRCRHQHRAEARQLDDFEFAYSAQQRIGELAVARLAPQTRGVDERAGQPQVGVGGRVGVDQRPAAVVVPPPAPAGQARREVAAREVAFGPAEQGVEGSAVVRDECEKERVGLAFRGGVAGAVLVVDDAAVALHEARPVSAPERPIATFGPGRPSDAGASAGADRTGPAEHGAARGHTTPFR